MTSSVNLFKISTPQAIRGQFHPVYRDRARALSISSHLDLFGVRSFLPEAGSGRPAGLIFEGPTHSLTANNARVVDPRVAVDAYHGSRSSTRTESFHAIQRLYNDGAVYLRELQDFYQVSLKSGVPIINPHGSQRAIFLLDSPDARRWGLVDPERDDGFLRIRDSEIVCEDNRGHRLRLGEEVAEDGTYAHVAWGLKALEFGAEVAIWTRPDGPLLYEVHLGFRHLFFLKYFKKILENRHQMNMRNFFAEVMSETIDAGDKIETMDEGWRLASARKTDAHIVAGKQAEPVAEMRLLFQDCGGKQHPVQHPRSLTIRGRLSANTADDAAMLPIPRIVGQLFAGIETLFRTGGAVDAPLRSP